MLYWSIAHTEHIYIYTFAKGPSPRAVNAKTPVDLNGTESSSRNTGDRIKEIDNGVFYSLQSTSSC